MNPPLPSSTASTSPARLTPIQQHVPATSVTTPPRWAIPLLSAVFVLSGAAGLIYESIWSRYLGLFVGHSAYAQIIVLVIFLGGMSLGAYLVGERSSRVRHPLLWYAGVELAVGLIGFTFHDVFVFATNAAYDRWFPHLAGGASVTVVKWVLAALLILPQSVLLGTTFPLMSAGVMRLRSARAGHVLGLLYFANSLGAAAGVLAAGFALIAWFGLPGTLLSAAMLNFLAAIAVGAPVRAGHLDDSRPLEVEPAVSSGSGDTTDLRRLLLFVSFGTALSSFIYEIGWIRMLSLVLGSATHSFELMLSAFILGLALGAFWVRRRADSFTDPIRALGIVQWVMGVLAIATLPIYIESFSWTAWLINALKTNDSGYHAFVVARYAICLLVMLPATFCAGMTLPLITRMLMKAGAGERAIGAVYSVNTFGSIIGAALAGLVLMPLLGLKWLLIAGALVDIVIGAMLVSRTRGRAPQDRATITPRARRPYDGPAAMATLVLLVSVVVYARFDHSVLTSGVYRHGVLSTPGMFDFLYYKDGRTATVSVRRAKGDTNALMTLATNGKPDASVEAVWRHPLQPGATRNALAQDLGTQVLLPVVTLAHRPRARLAAVIGQGSGMTSHFLLGSPLLERLYTIEIEPAMIEGSRALMPANRRVFEDPRSTFIIDDAKSFFAGSGRRFDLILSEPSNPWVSGVSGLFTEEFYGHVKRQLADDGVFGQWLHLYEIDDTMVLSVLAAIDRSFPAYEIFLTSNADLLVIATKQRAVPTPDWSVIHFPGIRGDLARVLPFTPASLEALRLAGRNELHPYLARHSAVNSDYYPILDLGTERTRFFRMVAHGITSVSTGRFDMMAALSGRRVPFESAHLAPAPEVPRVSMAAASSQLRQLRDAGVQHADSVPDEDLRGKLFRLRRLEQTLAGAQEPADWGAWVQDVTASELDLHAGSAGVADERFYRPLFAFLDRTHPPAEARAAVEFLHGMASWDWAQVQRASEPLRKALLERRAWLDPQMVREVSVIGRLRSGDVEGAASTIRRFSAAATQPPTFRDHLLANYVLSAEQAQRSGARDRP